MLPQEAVVRTEFSEIMAQKGLAQSLVPAKCLTHGLLKLSNLSFCKTSSKRGTRCSVKTKNKQMPWIALSSEQGRAHTSHSALVAAPVQPPAQSRAELRRLGNEWIRTRPRWGS